MRTLYSEVVRLCAKNGGGIVTHLCKSGIHTWDDLTKANLADFRDHLLESVAHSSAHTYVAQLSAVIARYEDELTLPKDWRSIMRIKNEIPVKTYLTRKEIEKFAAVTPKNAKERYVQACFLVSCWTGMRVSDAKCVTEENITGGYLRYTAIKTGIEAVVPAKPGLWDLIRIVQEYPKEMGHDGYNNWLRKMCLRAGITEKVKVVKAGKHLTLPKWQCVSSHTGRVSFASCLNEAGAGLVEIATLMGHRETSTTLRYICKSSVNLSPRALQFFQ